MSEYEELLSPSEVAFFECRDALDRVTDAFLDLRSGTVFPSTYEADMAATYLFACAWQAVNAISHLTEIRYVGSHFIPAQCLCRSAVEVGLTAYWLVREDDWRLREARWLRYVRREEKYRGGLASDFGALNAEISDRLRSERVQLESRRNAIDSLLKVEFAKDGIRADTERTPSFSEILSDLKLRDQIYPRYRLLSHSLHGGPSQASTVLRIEGDNVGWYMAHSPRDWSDLFLLAGHALCAGASDYAKRISAPSEKVAVLNEALSDLARKSQYLEESYRISREGSQS